MTDLIRLTTDIIEMRKYPLKNKGALRYPQASIAFAEAVRACEDHAILREIIRIDTGHVLPTVSKQQVYQKLLSHPQERTSEMLQAFAMHLVMFGITDENGVRLPDADAHIDALLAEAEAKKITDDS
jgi:hypothetical protein